MTSNWSESEVEAAVADYFDMLRSELTGRKYNKTAHRRALMEQLNNRSDGSVELKHQNISAVLIEMGIPYIDGYKPRSNYQRALLPAAVSEFLKNHAEFHALFKADSEAVPTIPTVSDFLAAMEAPPSSAGFDIRSFEENGRDRFIEAKTTKYGKNTPFFVTANELRFSEENSSRYYLYRLFRFRADPKLFALQGQLGENCILEASQYVARPR